MTETGIASASERTPGVKFFIAVLIALLLAIPLFSVYLLVYDRQSQSETARASIAEGWGGPQIMSGPLLAIPYQDQASETVVEGGKPVTHTRTVWRELTLSPATVMLDTKIAPERRKRSIYEAVVYEATNMGQARFALPPDLARLGIDPARLAFDRAELRFGLSDPRGLFGPPPRVVVGGQALPLQPGRGSGEASGTGFFAWLDAGALRTGAFGVDFAYQVRGNGSLSLAPQAGDTSWTVASKWPHPSFQGNFLPAQRTITPDGFRATYRLGNLALGKSLASLDTAADKPQQADGAPEAQDAQISLVQPVDLYSQVNRAVKYGFLFIGFTFLAFLMFDLIGGVRVSAVEYVLVGVGLILFFVLLLALAEIIGFTAAYIVASAAIIGEIGAYSAAVLKSWRRSGLIAGLLAALYAVLYILLSLEAFSLLIGSLLLFAALGAVMYVTRNLDWSGQRRQAA